MSTWDAQNFYYSGQGVVLIGNRTAAGRAAGLVPVGNVSELKISIATTVVEHHESETGQRAIDLRLVTLTKGALAVTLENFIAQNLATSLRGETTAILAATGTSETIAGYNGKVTPLNYSSVSTLVLKRGATTLTAFNPASPTTPYDYKANLDAGSVLLNDGATVLTAGLTTGGTAPSAVTVGNPTVVTVANTAVVGDYVMFSGFTGADAATLNKKSFRVTVASPSAVSINVNTVGMVITVGTPLSFFDGTSLTATYNSAAQNRVEALTLGQQTRYLRFEGLNTADGFNPVVVEVFKFVLDPTKDLELISDTLDKFVLDGSVLADQLQTTGSKFFKVTMLR